MAFELGYEFTHVNNRLWRKTRSQKGGRCRGTGDIIHPILVKRRALKTNLFFSKIPTEISVTSGEAKEPARTLGIYD